MQFFGKCGNFVCWCPPSRDSWRPLLRGILDLPLLITLFHATHSGIKSLSLPQHVNTMSGINSGSCFGFRGPVCRLRVPVFFVMGPFFCNVPAHYNISVAHNKNLWRITKKLVPITCKVRRNRNN